MYTIKADIIRNRLCVTLDGFFNYKEMKECTDKTIEESRKLKPGYDVITDISHFKAVEQETLAEVKRAQAHFKVSGVRHAIRVQGDSLLTGLQFSRVGKTIDFVPEIVATIAEAEKILDAQPQEVS